MIFDLPGHDSLQRIPTLDPMRGAHAHVGALIEPVFECRGAVRRPGPNLVGMAQEQKQPRRGSETAAEEAAEVETDVAERKGRSTTTWTRSSTRSIRYWSRTPRIL